MDRAMGLDRPGLSGRPGSASWCCLAPLDLVEDVPYLGEQLGSLRVLGRGPILEVGVVDLVRHGCARLLPFDLGAADSPAVVGSLILRRLGIDQVCEVADVPLGA